MSFRDKFVFLSRKIGILLFLAFFAYALLIRLFGEDIFPGKYLFVIFFSAALFLILTLVPPKINKEYWRAWFFFLSLIFIILGMGLGIVLNSFQVITRESFIVKIFGGITILGMIGFFFSLIIQKSKSFEEIRKNIIESFKNVSKNLSLNCQNKSSDRVVNLTAEGNYKFGYIILYVENELWKDPHSVRQHLTRESSIFIATNQEIKPFKIETYHRAIRIDGLDEPIKSKITDFIQKKNLNHLDFNINIHSLSEKLLDFFTKLVPKHYLNFYYKNYKYNLVIKIDEAIEETDLWMAYIDLAEKLLSNS